MSRWGLGVYWGMIYVTLAIETKAPRYGRGSTDHDRVEDLAFWQRALGGRMQMQDPLVDVQGLAVQEKGFKLEGDVVVQVPKTRAKKDTLPPPEQLEGCGDG